jgi:hypothetical protein
MLTVSPDFLPQHQTEEYEASTRGGCGENDAQPNPDRHVAVRKNIPSDRTVRMCSSRLPEPQKWGLTIELSGRTKPVTAVPDADHTLAAAGTARSPDAVRLNEWLDDNTKSPKYPANYRYDSDSENSEN